MSGIRAGPRSICWTPEVLWAYLDHGFVELVDGTVTMKCPREVEAVIFEYPDRSIFPRLGEIAAEVTVATGTGTDPPAMAAPRIADALPNATLETFEDLTPLRPLPRPAPHSRLHRHRSGTRLLEPI